MRKIESENIQSVLDIGAGFGELGSIISRKVEKYLAIEENPYCISALTIRELDVLAASFPIKLDDHFDMVLCCYSLAIRPGCDFKAFINQAWNLVNDGGSLVLAMYEGYRDDWTELLRYINEDDRLDARFSLYQSVIAYLATLSEELTTQKLTSVINTDSYQKMVESLAFLSGNGDPDRSTRFIKKAEKAIEFLNSYRTKENLFIFSVVHELITIKK